MDWWISPSFHLLLADLERNDHVLIGGDPEGANPDVVLIARFHSRAVWHLEVVDVAIGDWAHDARAVGRRHRSSRHGEVGFVGGGRGLTTKEPDVGNQADPVYPVAPCNRDLNRDDLPVLNQIVRAWLQWFQEGPVVHLNRGGARGRSRRVPGLVRGLGAHAV